MNVERIHTDTGSHIEPPLDPSWSEQEKIEWQAAVVRADTGLSINVKPARFSRNGIHQRGYFDVAYQAPGISGSHGPMTYEATWTFLNGVSLGADLSSRGAVRDPAVV